MMGAPVWHEIADGWQAQREVDPQSRIVYEDVAERIERGQRATQTAITLGKAAIIPPLVLLAIGAAFAWAFAGFRKQEK